jgi:4-amino-4-deoxy-L-arabinose transferase-like glycosyltransferase
MQTVLPSAPTALPPTVVPVERRPRHRELLFVAVLSALALALRWPLLQEVPRYTDELQEILWSLDIARGQSLPLTAVDSYYGPLWSYLLAGLFVLVGPSPWLPRIVAALLGAGAVGLTYGFARSIAGRGPAAIAALLMLTSGGQVVINSHTARSNNVTPLLTTAALWLLWLALEPRPKDGLSNSGPPARLRPALLVPAGLLIGLALQTHLSVVALLPGLALYALWRGGRLLKTRWPYLAVLAVLLGYLNMIVYNLLNDFWSFRHARSLQEGYTGGRSTDLGYYLSNLASLAQSLSRLLSGTIDSPDSPARFLYGALALIGLLLLARRHGTLLILATLSICSVLPYFNPRYGPILSGRYLIPLLPIGYLAIGLAVIALAQRLRPARPCLPAALITSLLALLPLWHLVAYYHDALADGRTNQPLLSLQQAVLTNHDGDEPVLLDEGLAQEALGAGGTDLKALRMLVGTSGLDYQVVKVAEVDANLTDHPSALAIMEAKKRSALPRAVRATPLSPEIESASGSEHRYALFRLTSR